MAVLGRGKKYSDKPGWALDPKTKLELKIRENRRKLPAEHGGKLYDSEVENAIKRKEISLSDAGKINAIQEMMRKEREERGSRNIVTSENRAEFMAKKLKLDEPKEKEEIDDQQFPSSVIHEDQEYTKTGKLAKHKKGWHEAEYDYKGSRVWAQAGGKKIRKE